MKHQRSHYGTCGTRWVTGASVSFVDRLDGLTSPQQSATPPQQISKRESEGFEQVLGNHWLGGRDSNPDTQIQSLQSYH
jgi:hypothetical protein